MHLKDFDKSADCEITVTAINAVGRSKPATIMWSAPTAPSPVRDLAASSTTDSLSLNWRTPADLGHSSLADYEVVQDRHGAIKANLRTTSTYSPFRGWPPARTTR